MNDFRFQRITIVIVSSIWIIFGVSLLIPSQSREGKGSVIQSLSQTRGLIREDVERKGKCSAVPYGNLEEAPEWDYESKEFLKEKLVQEVLVHLDQPDYVSPPNKYGEGGLGPVIVDIGIYVQGISEVDMESESFLIEGFMDMVWCDRRLRFDNDAEQRYDNRHIYLETDAAKELEQIWWPDITFVNEIGERTVENQELIIEADGTVEYREKFAVDLHSKFKITKFPFDDQTMLIELESFAWNKEILLFEVEKDLIDFDANYEIPEFTMHDIRFNIIENQEPRERYPFSKLIIEFDLKRKYGYYLTKVIIPLVLIVVVSWGVFWMDGVINELGNRMAISFTGILTAVAFQFLIADKLPDHIYDTFLDNFILVSLFNLVLTVIINVIVAKAHKDEFDLVAKKIDKICRVLFPFMFLIGCLLIAGNSLLWSKKVPHFFLVVFALMFLIVGLLVGYAYAEKRKTLWNQQVSIASDSVDVSLKVGESDGNGNSETMTLVNMTMNSESKSVMR